MSQFSRNEKVIIKDLMINDNRYKVEATIMWKAPNDDKVWVVMYNNTYIQVAESRLEKLD